ncbi:MAG: NAD(P)-binding domain-containing protein [Gemmatimonadota bacterium]|nr:MAG: NAD(P)-binding domain-containing protein [Gemmatimonadota bacterium]
MQAIRRALGRDWEVVSVGAPAVSDGDGAAATSEAVAAVRGAELYFGWGVPPAVASAASGTLRWAHTAAAGVRASLSPELLATRAVFTNSRGIHAEPLADWALTAIAYCVRGFHWAVAAQRAGRWAKDEFTDGTVPIRDFSETRVGVVGLGGVGRAVARRCHAVGMEVRGIRRNPSRRRPAGVAWVGGPADLAELARRSDVLVLAAPQTRETDGVVGAAALAALPRGAFVVNLARGGLLDEEALREQLERGRIAGCVLDVFGQEPLPAGHPLWTDPRVLVFPHAGAVSTGFWKRETDLIVDNVRRYLAGRRLKNVVDPQAGY